MFRATFILCLLLFGAGGHASEAKGTDGADGPPGASDDTSNEQYSSVAQKCGYQYQNEFNHSEGIPKCGRAVANMIQCVAKSVDINCDASCGNGRDFINCTEKMTKCGYQKIKVTSELCRKPGAVLSYEDSGTTNGHLYGHVEFACGDNIFCSVYKAPAQGNWKNAQNHQHQTPDACWFPAKNGKVPDAGKIPAGEMTPGPSGGGSSGGDGVGSPAPSNGTGGGSTGFGGGGGLGGGGSSGGANILQSLAPVLAGAAIGYLAYRAAHPPIPQQQYILLSRPGAPPVLVPVGGAYGTVMPTPLGAPYATPSAGMPYPYQINYPGSPVAQTPLYLSGGQYMYAQPQYRIYSVGGR